MGSKPPLSTGLRLAGLLAVVLGALLAVAAVDVGADGYTLLVVPGAESVGLLALVFMIGGWGILRRVPGAMPLLALAYVYLGTCQILAGLEVAGLVPKVEHAVFAAWLWSGAVALGLHWRELREAGRKQWRRMWEH